LPLQKTAPCILLGIGLLILLLLACVSPQLNLMERLLHLRDERQQADVVVVFSATQLSQCHAHPHAFMREGFGAELLREGYSRSGKLLISGLYSQPPYPQAQCHAHLAQLFRIPPPALLMDNASETTYENAVHVEKIMRAHGWKTALLVTSDSHMRRSLLAMTRQGVKAYPSQIPDYPPFHNEWFTPNRMANLQRLLYEYGALLKYRWYGYI
jgi:uncharacterized SAM-binding protein YcdF (DUF218 family)